MELRYIIVLSIIIYPLLALLIIKRIIKKQNNKNSLNALDYYKKPKRAIEYQFNDNGIFFSFDKSLLPLKINGINVDKDNYQLSNIKEVNIENDKFANKIDLINHQLISNDFRDIGGLKVNNGFISFNKIYRISNISNLNDIQTEELLKTNFCRIFNLNKKVNLKNNKLVINKDTSVSINILSRVSGIIQFLNQEKLDYFTWHAHVIYENIIDEKKNIGRLLKKIMEAKGSVIIQDGDGHYQTGVIIMLILLMLGVDKEDIANEYSISNLSVKKDVTLKSDIHNTAIISNSLVIKKVINNIDGNYDSIEKFFEDLDISKDSIDNFKDKLIIKSK